MRRETTTASAKSREPRHPAMRRQLVVGGGSRPLRPSASAGWATTSRISVDTSGVLPMRISGFRPSQDTALPTREEHGSFGSELSFFKNNGERPTCSGGTGVFDEKRSYSRRRHVSFIKLLIHDHEQQCESEHGGTVPRLPAGWGRVRLWDLLPSPPEGEVHTEAHAAGEAEH